MDIAVMEEPKTEQNQNTQQPANYFEPKYFTHEDLNSIIKELATGPVKQNKSYEGKVASPEILKSLFEYRTEAGKKLEMDRVLNVLTVLNFSSKERVDICKKYMIEPNLPNVQPKEKEGGILGKQTAPKIQQGIDKVTKGFHID